MLDSNQRDPASNAGEINLAPLIPEFVVIMRFELITLDPESSVLLSYTI